MWIAQDGFEGSIAVEGPRGTNLRYTANVMLIVGNLEELQNLVNRVKSQIEKAGLVLDIKKMKMRKSQRSPLEMEVRLIDVILRTLTGLLTSD